MSEGAPGVAVPSIGVVHFCLRVPHVDLADYRRQQRLLVAPFARRLAWRSFAVGVSIGALITFPLVIAAFYWNFWADVTLEFGLGRLIRPVVIDGAATWLGVAAVFFAGYVAARIDGVVLYKSVLRKMYASSRREPSDWTLLLGDDGFQMVVRGMVSMVPWSMADSFQEGNSASFLTMNHNLRSVVISHKAFASLEEQNACLNFIRSRVPGPSTQSP